MDNAAVESQLDILLNETFALIPELFHADLDLQQKMQSKIPQMRAYTRKMWLALGARSIPDYVSLTAALGNAFVTCSPKTVLNCSSSPELSQRMADWVQKTLGIEFTLDDLLARGTLELIAAKLAMQVNDKMGKLRNTR